MPDEPSGKLPGHREQGGYSGPTYYGQPQLKPSPFGWKVSLYIYLAGLSGSSQILATLGDIFGGRAARGDGPPRALSLDAGGHARADAADPRSRDATALLQHAAHLQADLTDVGR